MTLKRTLLTLAVTVAVLTGTAFFMAARILTNEEWPDW